MSLKSRKTGRLMSLDVFRGVTIFMMIVVNSPGTSGQLSHASWSGVTLADVVFPFFIFIVGLSIGINRHKFQVPAGQQAKLITTIVKRTLSLFVLGLLVNAFYTDFSSVRIMGVLQRIALVYCACALMTVYMSPRKMFWTCITILLVYWLMILWIPFPGGVNGSLEKGHNLINWFDERFLPGMLWRGTWDPEGLLSTFPAVVTGLSGVLFGLKFSRGKSLDSVMLQLFSVGFLLFAAGFLWSPFFPLIKQIWSSSFVMLTSGLAAMSFATFIYFIEPGKGNAVANFFRIFGLNAMAVYLFHVVLNYLLNIPVVGVSLHERFMVALEPGLGSDVATGIYIILFMSACFALNYGLYRKKIFLKL